MFSLFQLVVDWVGYFLRGLFVGINNLYCIPTYVVWCFLLQPLRLINPELYWEIEGQLFYWLLSMVAYWSHSNDYRIVESGDEIDDLVGEQTLLLINHQSTSDVPLLMAAFSSRNGVLQSLNWIMDAVFRFTNFGVVSSLHGDFFINAGRERRDASINDLVTYLKQKYVPRGRKWLVLFPEGGFLRKRQETSNKYARKLGLPELEHVTLPRTGALQAIFNTIGPGRPNMTPEMEETGLKWVLDVTIAYPRGVPLDLISVVTGYQPSCNVNFHYRLFPIHDVPAEQEELQGWLYCRYMEKEALLKEYYKSGVWTGIVPSMPEATIEAFAKAEIPVWFTPLDDPTRGKTFRRVEQDLSRIFIVHVFFILSSCLHLFLFSQYLNWYSKSI